MAEETKGDTHEGDTHEGDTHEGDVLTQLYEKAKKATAEIEGVTGGVETLETMNNIIKRIEKMRKIEGNKKTPQKSKTSISEALLLQKLKNFEDLYEECKSELSDEQREQFDTLLEFTQKVTELSGATRNQSDEKRETMMASISEQGDGKEPKIELKPVKDDDMLTIIPDELEITYAKFKKMAKAMRRPPNADTQILLGQLLSSMKSLSPILKSDRPDIPEHFQIKNLPNLPTPLFPTYTKLRRGVTKHDIHELGKNLSRCYKYYQDGRDVYYWKTAGRFIAMARALQKMYDRIKRVFKCILALGTFTTKSYARISAEGLILVTHFVPHFHLLTRDDYPNKVRVWYKEGLRNAIKGARKSYAGYTQEQFRASIQVMSDDMARHYRECYAKYAELAPVYQKEYKERKDRFSEVKFYHEAYCSSVE